MRKPILLCGAAALALAASSAPAWAQDGGAELFKRDRSVGVRDRPRPEYDALGVRVSSFLVLPKVTVGEAYEDNIYANTTGGVSDEITTLTPEVQALSTWSRHAARFFARLGYEGFANRSSESNTTYAFGGSGQLDVSRNTVVTGSGSYQHLVESRTVAGTPTSVVDPIEFDQGTLNFTASHTFNRIRLQGRFDYESYNYKNNRLFDGSFYSQDFRDEDLFREGLRADYAISPATSFYLDLELNQQQFRQAAGSRFNRDSNGVQIQAGVDFDLTRLARGNFQVGNLNQSYDDKRIGTISGLGLRGRVQYFPSELMTFTFTADRSVQNTGLVETPSFIYSTIEGAVDYELRRNLIVSAKLGYGRAEFEGLDRNDDRFTTTASAVYLVNRWLGINVNFTRVSQTSTGTPRGPKYDDDRVSVSLVLQR